ncbi:cysteine-rich motor neuron 1 protein-like isoform X2 [Physella acuta]|uniref:cysteine-rich motor neuron 1 protein-like isoform X2 n=1 Tax=Physella acuta TaxID=109671 RepID=UPI0027DE65C6|nr:cysteine-rich motor neuron 1 protein-like isoform X2 [Physella acuta]
MAAQGTSLPALAALAALPAMKEILPLLRLISSLIIYSTLTGSAWALSCAPCEPELCPNTTSCLGGTVKDVCGCCPQCARLEHQSCGGVFGVLGSCAPHLQCVYPDHEETSRGGICKVPEQPCKGSNCPPVYEAQLCPPDSTLTRRDLTSPDTQYNDVEGNNLFLLPEQAWQCVCNVSLCRLPVCQHGQPRLVQNATGLPGTCCHVFECPADDSRTCVYKGQEKSHGQVWQVDNCTSCQCLDGVNRCWEQSCPKLACSLMVVPDGQCCPVCTGCVSETGQVHNDTEVWHENPCTTCVCKDGYPQCQAEVCSHCQHSTSLPGLCCPTCPDHEAVTLTFKPCPSLRSCTLTCPYGLEQTDDGCYTCRCKQAKCQLDCQFGLKLDAAGNQLCECGGAPDRCPPWDERKCPIQCEYGFRRSREGCIKCKCNKCPQFNCTKRCMYGHVLTAEGCPQCLCREPPIDVSGVARGCLSPEGSHHRSGEVWSDGCRRCYCHSGVEMCSLIACPAPHCHTPVFRVGDCCPTCPGLTVPNPSGEICESAIGKVHGEGEMWMMDECTHCMCQAGDILCQTPTCPPVICTHPVRASGECCATCPELNLTLSGMKGQGSCHSSTSVTYQHGDVWQSDPCQSCVCRQGQIHCYSQVCPPLTCTRTVLVKSQCCPVCLEPASPRTGCVHNGVEYEAGERWRGENCSQCLCSAGQVECFPLSCPTLICSIFIQRRGDCCPECYALPTIDNMNFPAENGNKSATGAAHMDRPTIIISVLAVMVLILATILVIFLVQLILRRKRSRLRPRPKSTNVELQGQMPFIRESEVNLEKKYLDKLCPVLTPGDRCSNDYTHMTPGDRCSNDYTHIVYSTDPR